MTIDLLTGTGLRIADAILLSVPVFGSGSRSCCGDAKSGPPWRYRVLIASDLRLVWRQIHTKYSGPRRTSRTRVAAVASLRPEIAGVCDPGGLAHRRARTCMGWTMHSFVVPNVVCPAALYLLIVRRMPGACAPGWPRI